MRSAFLLLLVTVLGLVPFACSDSDESDDDDDDNGGGGTIEPASGEWEFDGDPSDNEACSVEESDLGDPDGVFTIANNGDGTLTVTPDDGTDPFDCDLNGAKFDCPDRYSDEIDIDLVEATITIKATASGTFSSNTEMSGTQDATISCAGSGCSTVEAYAGVTFPCDASQTFTATAK